MKELKENKTAIFLSGIYILACILIANLPSPAHHRCDYENQHPGHEQQCAYNDAPRLYSSVTSFINWIAERKNDEWIALGTIIIALFTVALATFTYMLVRDARETTRRQLRAYVFVESGTLFDSSTVAPFSPERKLFPVANFLIKNSGQTPAFRQVSWGQLAVIRPEEENTLVVPTALQLISPMTLGANSTHPIISRLNPERALTPQEIVDVQTGVRAIFAYGRLEYLDTFGTLRWTNYRLSYTGDFPPPTNMIFNFSVGGNDAS